MRVLIFSDLHLHIWPYGASLVDGMNSRLKAQADALDVIAAASVDAYQVVFCGDLFHCHGKMDASVLKVAYEGLSKIIDGGNVAIDVLVGNHDMSDKSMVNHSLHWLNAFNNTGNPPLRVIDTPVHNHRLDHYNGLPFSYLPYTEDKKVIEKFFAECGEVCFMHQGVANVPMGSGFLIDEILTEDMIPDHVKHVFTGHYHKHNKVSDKLTIVGSTMQHTWNDAGDDRGYLWYDTETGEIEHVDVGGPRFVTFKMGETSAALIRDNFLRVTNYEGQDTDELRKEFMGIGARSVEFVQKVAKTKKLDLSGNTGGFHLPTLVEEYTKQQGIDDDRSKVGKELMK